MVLQIDPAIDPDWSYNPRQGFIIDDALMNIFKPGLYECKGRNSFQGSEQSISIFVLVPRMNCVNLIVITVKL